MTTYATLKERIALEIKRPSWADTYVANAVQDAIKHHRRKRFNFNVDSFKLVTVAGQENYTLPEAITTPAGVALVTGENLLEIDGMSLRYNTSAYPVVPVTEAWLEMYTTTATQGQPMYYCWIGNRLRFAPVPDQAYTIHIAGIKSLSTLNAATDTNAWTDEAEKLIRAHAKKLIYRDVLRNPGQAEASAIEEAEALASLTAEVDAKQTGRIMAWGY